ncbi:hypothetical protein C6P42_000618 [Pichia californica]|nr:hypothetical protein C6P42_000618 [[Candida] californica]
MIFSIGLFFVKKTPKFVTLLLTIINIIMIFFVMNGSTHDSDAYADIYLVEYQFNNTGGISSALSSQYSSAHDGNNIDEFIMRVGFMGVCINFGDGMECGYIGDMDYTYGNEVPSFSISSSNKNSTSTASLGLFDIAYKIQDKTFRYHIFIVEIIFLLVLFVVQFYNMIGFLPFQKYVTYIAIFVVSSFWIILTISITWIMVVAHDLVNIGSVMTMNILSFSSGKRAPGILWAAFSITIVQLLYYGWIVVKDEEIFQRIFNRSSNKKSDVEKDAGSMSDSVMSSITTLRGTL